MDPAQATTDCYQQSFDFQALGRRRVEVDFSGGHLSSDGGCLLLREVDRTVGLGEKLAKCFTDFRDQRFVEHRLPVMLRQRILGIALGYEDINDHDKLRLDPLLAAMCGREDLLGEERHLTRDKGKGWRAKARSIVWSSGRRNSTRAPRRSRRTRTGSKPCCCARACAPSRVAAI
jgi:hypothetical protein